jgi:hypothetical protein
LGFIFTGDIFSVIYIGSGEFWAPYSQKKIEDDKRCKMKDER